MALGETGANVKSATLASYARVESIRVSHHRSTGSIRPSLRDGVTVSFVLSPVIGLCCHHRQRNAKHCRQLDASAEAPVARFPKFVRYLRPHLHELRKAKGN